MEDELFEVLSEDTFNAEMAKGAAEVPERTNSTRRKREPVTEPRTFTNWYALTTAFGPCSVPGHDEFQDTMNPEQKVYRSKYYKHRMVYELREGFFICRDCFIAEVDKHVDP